MLTNGAQMKRVDHPGSPGAEAVLAAGAADRWAGETSEGDTDGAIETSLWGASDAVVPDSALHHGGFDVDAQTLRSVTRQGTDRLRRSNGRRSPSSRGRSIGAGPMVGPPRDVAWEATLRAVAHKQHGRVLPAGPRFIIEADELLKRRRIRPPDHLLLLVVDASGSMAGKLTSTARTLAERALERAYTDRRRVAMIAFRAHSAELLFGPTNRVERARTALDKLPLGGATPLGRGLDLAHQTLRRAAVQANYGRATVLVISDGDANVGDRRGYGSAFLDVEQASRKLVAVANTEIILLDTTEAGQDQRPALWLVEQLHAKHIKLSTR